MDLLIDYGLVLANITLRSVQQQVAAGVDFHFLSALETKFDDLGVRAGRHDEIVFQLSLIAVVDQVDARIHLTVLDFRIRSYVGPRLLGVVSNEVVDLPWQLIFSCQSGPRVGSDPPHAQDAGSVPAAGPRDASAPSPVLS